VSIDFFAASPSFLRIYYYVEGKEQAGSQEVNMAEMEKNRALSGPATSHFPFNSSPSRVTIYGNPGSSLRVYDRTTTHCLLLIPIQVRLEILDGEFSES
jgi:hypothetical protein